MTLQITENIHDALSDATAPAVHRLIDKLSIDVAKQPKYVKPECDVLSILEEEVTISDLVPMILNFTSSLRLPRNS